MDPLEHVALDDLPNENSHLPPKARRRQARGWEGGGRSGSMFEGWVCRGSGFLWASRGLQGLLGEGGGAGVR
eukprot:4391045-Pyramimonas_sp.AAC.1